MNAPSVAVVILNWNGRHFLEKYLPSVLASGYPGMKVVVADNGSTDGSVQLLTSQFPEAQLILLSKNEGFAGGYNIALRQVYADYYILLNSDVAVPHGWIEPMIQLLETEKDAAACQPKILSEKDHSVFEYAGASGGWIDHWGFPFCRGRVFDNCELDRGQYNDVQPVFWASGAALCIRAEYFWTSGGFDERLFAHQEEIDMCWRLQNMGLKILVQPASEVYHVGGGSLEQGKPQKVYLNFRNNLVILKKNLCRRERRWKIPMRIFLNNLAALQYFFSGKKELYEAIRRAHKDFRKWKRERIHQSFENKPMEELNGVFKGSVVWQHFLLRKKTFQKIVGSIK